jgi:hypothetical protein
VTRFLSGGPAVPGLIDYNFLKLREAVGKVFAVRNRIMQQEAGLSSDDGRFTCP